jgi:hypothetical protein
MTLQGDAANTKPAAARHARLLDVAALPDRAAHHAHYRGMCW